MDLSINRNNAKNINFEGVKYTYDTKNLPVLKFTVPPHKDVEDAAVEIILYNESNPPKLKKIISLPIPKGSDTVELDEKSTSYVVNRSNGLLYRYKIGNNHKTDNTETCDVEGQTFNILKTSKNFGITPKTGTMRHSFVDSDVSPEYLEALKSYTPNGKIKIPQGNPNFVHNHFNKLGGTLQGIDYLLTKTDELAPYRYIISTPDIGADPTSSHRYWPNNLYQCGDIQTFKDLNFHLFERGKGYVADGAFTSQSLQSPLMQHIYKWGDKSPWFRMIKVEKNVAPGVLPEPDTDAFNHTGVKIINNPKGNYDKNKPTYIQFFDDRLVSEKQKNSNEIIKKTDKIPEDHYDFTSNDDSVYMFTFEISPSDSDRIKEFKKAGKNYVLLKDINDLSRFLTFPNFKIKTRNSAKNYQAWDGQRDIVKMNLSNSNDTNAMEAARQYIYGVASYWTETVQSDLILRTAKAAAKQDKTELQNIAKSNGVDLDQIERDLSDAVFPTLNRRKSIGEYIKEFPLQSIETSPELSAIFAQPAIDAKHPSFNEDLFKDGFASRIEQAVQETIYNAIPEKYKKDKDYVQYVIKTYAPEIIKGLLASSLDKKAVSKDGTLDLNVLKNVTLKSIETRESISPEDERSQVIKKIVGGFSPNNIKPIQEKIKKELKNISLEDFKIAESLVVQGKGGLNWRFDAAKDIGDLDAVRAGKRNFSNTWAEVETFWTNFIANVREYNPSSYVINEVTDLYRYSDDASSLEKDFLNKTGSTTSSNYSNYFNKLACFVGVNAENFDTGDNNPIARAGNVEKLYESITSFVNSNQPNNIDLSHSFVENHDKPRVLHVLPLDSKLFHSTTLSGYEKLAKEMTGSNDYKHMSPKAIAVAQAMNNCIESEHANGNISDKEAQKLKEVLKQLAAGKKTLNPKEPLNYKRAEAFAITPYEVSIKDLFKKAGINDEKRMLDFHYSMLNKAMDQQISMWEMMNAIPGTPTLFNGAEFAQTGFETLNKNEFQTNRGQILHHLQNDRRYSSYYNKMQAVSGLYKLDKLSAIRDGAKIILSPIDNKVPFPSECNDDYIIKQTASNGGYKKVVEFMNQNLPDSEETYNKMYETFGIWYEKPCYGRFVNCYKSGKLEEAINTYNNNSKALQLLPIFSYDDKGSQVLQIVSNHGTPKNQQAHEAPIKEKSKIIPSIKIKDCPYPNGTILQRKVYKSGLSYSDETMKNSTTTPQKYIVQDGTIYPATKTGGKYTPDKNAQIAIDDTVLTFYKV